MANRTVTFMDATWRGFTTKVQKTVLSETCEFEAKLDQVAAEAMGVKQFFYDDNGLRKEAVKKNELSAEYWKAGIRLVPNQGELFSGSSDAGLFLQAIKVGAFKTSLTEKGLFIRWKVATDGAWRAICEFAQHVKSAPVKFVIERASEEEEVQYRDEHSGKLFEDEDEGEEETESYDGEDAPQGNEVADDDDSPELEPLADEDCIAIEREDGTYDPDAAKVITCGSLKDGTSAGIWVADVPGGFVASYSIEFTIGSRERVAPVLRAPVYDSERLAISEAAKAIANKALEIQQAEGTSKKQKDECSRIIRWASERIDATLSAQSAA